MPAVVCDKFIAVKLERFNSKICAHENEDLLNKTTVLLKM